MQRQDALNKGQTDTGTPGATQAIITPDGFTWEGATGVSNLDTQTPTQVEDTFNVGSITKSFTAATVLKLAESGQLSLDDTLDQWLPDVAANIPDGKDITIRQMLNGSSGIPDYINDAKFNADVQANFLSGSTRKWQPEELVAYIYGQPRFSGDLSSKEWVYPNTGNVIVGLIIEKATGTTFAQAVREEVIDPLGLNNTFLDGYEPAIGSQATGYEDIFKADGSIGQDGTLDDVTGFQDPTIVYGAGGLISNAQDVTRYSNALFGGELLQPNSQKELLTFVNNEIPIPGGGGKRIPYEGNRYGLGIANFEDSLGNYYGKGGSDTGYRSETRYFPDQDGATVSILSNRRDAINLENFDPQNPLANDRLQPILKASLDTLVNPNSSSMIPTSPGTTQNDLIETSQTDWQDHSNLFDNSLTNSYNQDNSDRHIPLDNDGVNCGVVNSDDQLFSENCGVTLLADTNRDGLVNNSDQEGKQNWNNQHGAIFLPNLDDDSGKFQNAQVPSGIEGDRQLAKLNDANDSIVNGSEDEKDLAQLKIQPWQDAPEDSTVRLYTDSKSQPYVRMFLKKDGQYTAIDNDTTLQLSDLRNGASLAIEGKDIVRDADIWDGFVDLTLEAKTGEQGEQIYSDRVKLRVSPVLFQNNLMPVQELYATKYPEQTEVDSQRQAIEEFLKDNPNLSPERRELVRQAQSFQLNEVDQQKADQNSQNGYNAFIQDINTSLESNNSPTNLQLLDASGDQWTQDIFEPGYAAMPSSDGGQQIMHIFYRSANTSRSIEGFLDKEKTASLRDGGRSVFTELAGKDIGGVQQFSESWQENVENATQDTYNSTGNFEAIPSYQFNGENYPVGRMIFGSVAGNQPDPSFVKMLESQGYQDPITVDTSWLGVGHVDEFLSFVPAPNERGWTLAIASPDDAFGVLRDAQINGYGNSELFSGLETIQTGENGAKLVPAATTIDNLLADKSLQKANEFAQQKISESVKTIQAQTGISDGEIIELPVIFKSEDNPQTTENTEDAANYKLSALTPGVANGVVVNDQYLAPRQHGPIVNGVDLFEKQVEDKLTPLGTKVNWIEDWYYAHEGKGEVHCTTNALRDPSQSDPWWQEYSSTNA